MSQPNIIAKFTCSGCRQNMGVLRENGAVKCRGGCDQYYRCWECHKDFKYPSGKYKWCSNCTKKPTMCRTCGKNEVKWGDCTPCWKQKNPMQPNSGVCLLD